MTTWIYSPDGITPERRLRGRPAQHWVQDTIDPPTGHYIDITSDADANTLGYHELVVDPQPSPDHVRDGNGTLDGTVWRIGWVFSQEAQDVRLASEADEQERQQARNALAALRDFIQATPRPKTNNAEAVAAIEAIEAQTALQARILVRLIKDAFSE